MSYWEITLIWLAMIALFCVLLVPAIAIVGVCFITAKVEYWRGRNKPAEFEGWMV